MKSCSNSSSARKVHGLITRVKKRVKRTNTQPTSAGVKLDFTPTNILSVPGVSKGWKFVYVEIRSYTSVFEGLEPDTIINELIT